MMRVLPMTSGKSPRSTLGRAALFLFWLLLCLVAVGCSRPEPSGGTATRPEPAGAASGPSPAAVRAIASAMAVASGTPVNTGDPAASASHAAPRASPSASASPSPIASASAAPAAAATGAKLELLDAGREPRTALRYRFKPGTTERVKLVTGTTLALDVSGQKVPSSPMPDVELVAALKVLSVSPEGRARRELSVQRVGLAEGGTLDPALRDQLTSTLELIKGLKGKDEIDARGRPEGLKLTAGKTSSAMITQLRDQMQQSFAQMGAPFPEQPIGVGARWSISKLIVQQGIRVNQVATYELTELADGKGRTHVRLTQLAPRGPVRPPGMPMDVQAELLGMSAKGEGNMNFDLTRSVPEGELKTHARLEIRTIVETQKQDTKMELDVRVRFAREP